MIQFYEQGGSKPATVTEPEAIQWIRDRVAEKGIVYPEIMDPEYHMLLDFICDNWGWQIEPIVKVGGREIRIGR